MNKGFTIIELIISISLLLLAIIGFISFFVPAIKLTGVLTFRGAADYLAQEGLEVVKNMRDNNIINQVSWSTGLVTCSAGCQLDYKTGTAVQTSNNVLQAYTGNPLNLANGMYSYDPGTATLFKRKVAITQPFATSDILKVEVQVTWSLEGKNYFYSTIGYIYSL